MGIAGATTNAESGSIAAVARILWGIPAIGRDGPGYGPGGQTVTCSSDNGKRNYCPANTRGGVQMVRQRSDARCTQGYSWGYDQRGIWVDRGCRADFVVNTGYRPGGPGYGPGGQTITCSSNNGGRNYCPANTRGGVQ